MSNLDRTRKEQLMSELLELAAAQKGLTYPNPVTAAYVIKNGEVIATGVHQKAGQPHAEQLAIKEAGSAAEGSTVMVNLEPCTHVGRTPACSQVLIDSKVSNVIYGMKDPNPKVMANSSDDLLQRAGVSIEKGLLKKRARYLNDVFIINQRYNRAFITLKVAKSNDGKIALPGKERVLISNEESNNKVHQLRREHDAICVGVRTIINDDPLLNIRYGYEKDRPFTRVILDLDAEIPETAAIFKGDDPIIILCSERVLSGLNERLKNVIDARENKQDFGPLRIQSLATINNVFSWPQIAQLLYEKYSVCALLVEGGQMAISSLIKQGYFDKIITITSPNKMGPEGLPWKSDDSPDPFHGLTISSEKIGDDIWEMAYRNPADIESE